MTDNHFISPELADTMLASMLSAHRLAPTISQQLAAMYTRAAHQQLINQKGGKHAKLYNKTYIDGQSVLHGTNSSRDIQ
jgi:hypothetical protein